MKQGRLSRILKIVLLTTAVAAMAYAGGAVVAAWLLVRPRRRPAFDCIPQMRYGKLEPLTLLTSDGLRLHAWVLRTLQGSSNDWVLLLHGYGSDRTAVQNRARFYSRRGFNVLLLHFRGHGSSNPAMISYGFNERRDVKAAFDFIRELRPGHRVHIGINGISMGAAAAAYAIGHEEIKPDWIILESCYDNIHHALGNRLARRVGPWLAPFLAWPVERVVEQLVRLRAEDLDPAKALEKASCPVLLLAGDSEVVLKMVEIEYLYGCIPEPKRLVLFSGAGHEDLLGYDTKRYARTVDRFLCDFAPRPMPNSPEPAALRVTPMEDLSDDEKAAALPAAQETP